MSSETEGTADAKRAAGSVPFGRVNVTRSIEMPDGSRIRVVRKDIMDHALRRDTGAKK